MSKSSFEPRTLAPGFWVALCVRTGSAPVRSYVGQIQAVDDRGVRLTLVDWARKVPGTVDLFVPWSEMTAALVGTHQPYLAGFLEEAARWQKELNGADVPGRTEG